MNQTISEAKQYSFSLEFRHFPLSRLIPKPNQIALNTENIGHQQTSVHCGKVNSFSNILLWFAVQPYIHMHIWGTWYAIVTFAQENILAFFVVIVTAFGNKLMKVSKLLRDRLIICIFYLIFKPTNKRQICTQITHMVKYLIIFQTSFCSNKYNDEQISHGTELSRYSKSIWLPIHRSQWVT